MKIKVVHDKATGLSWVVRVISQGERYGKDDSMMHMHPEPLVEFYDTRYPLTDLGQMVSRYYVGTLLTGHKDGLTLDSGSSQWVIMEQALSDIRTWLHTVVDLQEISHF